LIFYGGETQSSVLIQCFVVGECGKYVN